jgi:hypothetical protein
MGLSVGHLTGAGLALVPLGTEVSLLALLATG